MTGVDMVVTGEERGKGKRRGRRVNKIDDTPSAGTHMAGGSGNILVCPKRDVCQESHSSVVGFGDRYASGGSSSNLGGGPQRWGTVWQGRAGIALCGGVARFHRTRVRG